MKLLLLIILLCGINSAPTHTINVVKAKKACKCHAKTAIAKVGSIEAASVDIIPSGLLFQF